MVFPKLFNDAQPWTYVSQAASGRFRLLQRHENVNSCLVSDLQNIFEAS